MWEEPPRRSAPRAGTCIADTLAPFRQHEARQHVPTEVIAGDIVPFPCGLEKSFHLVKCRRSNLVEDLKHELNLIVVGHCGQSASTSVPVW